MSNKTIQAELDQLKDTAWNLARRCLDQGERDLARLLVEFTERLTPDSTEESDSVIGEPRDNPSEKRVSIFAKHKGKSFKAEIRPHLASVNFRNPCVIYEGKSYTPSGAAREVTGTNVNGWRFWKYRVRGGGIASIETLRG